MKRIVLAICLLAVSMPAQAINRYDTSALTCQRIQAILQSEGSAILRYPSPRNSQLTLYDVYVMNPVFCQSGEHAISAFVPSSDNKRCRVRQCLQTESDQGGR
ncbi:MAG: hypothetical protein P1V21_01740 [Rhizobiaceae bacterium]|nr:hypothetical protein [Rhizobiaceae bacterium]|tara:strand:- start:1274 stop:1582 length:309 start_codon:yes stop_codon:yes gene_type:complete